MASQSTSTSSQAFLHVPRDGSGSHPSSNRESTSTSTSEKGRRYLSPLKTRYLERYYARQNVTARRPLAMAQLNMELDPLWQDLDWAIGQMLIMGWDGTEVTPQIRSLIRDHHLGTIILTAKNLKSAQETAKLVKELQTIAHQAGHPKPLLIALDQENGGVNSLFDEDYVCQFPSAMGVAATGRVELAYEVSKATATEVGACGINFMLGPVLDVLSNARYQPVGVRATGDDPQEVSQYGIAAINGIRDAGLACCGKHFPSYGNLDFLGSSLDVPIITQTLEELSLSALVPFRNAIATGKLDAMFVGDVVSRTPP
ncbi:beta-hexosaminidase [Colletotrichum liriopes]|uniref:Beta-hexosaminidase n=1 Tax=Colletotrichum liriopes TaxID=708192 RepID=A0AA37LXH2_9PEZI|nr:beta-hexosaminidase [Colletotrichum liriopes]